MPFLQAYLGGTHGRDQRYTRGLHFALFCTVFFPQAEGNQTFIWSVSFLCGGEQWRLAVFLNYCFLKCITIFYYKHPQQMATQAGTQLYPKAVSAPKWRQQQHLKQPEPSMCNCSFSLTSSPSNSGPFHSRSTSSGRMFASHKEPPSEPQAMTAANAQVTSRWHQEADVHCGHQIKKKLKESLRFP